MPWSLLRHAQKLEGLDRDMYWRLAHVIFDDIRNPVPHLVFADWLDERGLSEAASEHRAEADRKARSKRDLDNRCLNPKLGLEQVRKAKSV